MASKIPHGSKKAQYFLDVMGDIIRFAADFHHQVQHFFSLLLKPAVPMIELIAQQQANGLNFAHWVLFRAFFFLQASLQ
jgi:hypothetical protein